MQVMSFLASLATKLLAESKRVAVFVFTVSAFLATAIVLQKMGAPESTVLACITSAGAAATLALPFLINGVTKTDISKTEAWRAPAPGGTQP